MATWTRESAGAAVDAWATLMRGVLATLAVVALAVAGGLVAVSAAAPGSGPGQSAKAIGPMAEFRAPQAPRRPRGSPGSTRSAMS